MEAMDTMGGDPSAWRSYRCPVCSHTDDVMLAGPDAVLVACSYCDTPLELRMQARRQFADARVAQARLSGERARRSEPAERASRFGPQATHSRSAPRPLR
ncbi:MAG: hypothetical protein OXI46_01085 [Gemmatimonadota bacterium]|nr:hypothetical protein [Gemmatimonadota bacterium]